MSESVVQQREFEIFGQPARVFVGGTGPALLLIHGGWTGASMHWSPVWNQLAKHHRVIAPDLPGLGAPETPVLGSVREYAGWLVALLEKLGVDRAVIVGNSFGASVAWSLAGRAPDLCAGLVLVNGIPMPKTPAPLLWSGRTPFGRAVMRTILRKLSFTPAALPKAFADPSKVPSELSDALSMEEPPLLNPFAMLLIEGDGPPEPRVAPLILWGEEDRLAGTELKTARKLQETHSGSKLALIPRAGHFPQLEAPEAFVAAVEAFLGVGPQVGAEVR